MTQATPATVPARTIVKTKTLRPPYFMGKHLFCCHSNRFLAPHKADRERNRWSKDPIENSLVLFLPVEPVERSRMVKAGFYGNGESPNLMRTRKSVKHGTEEDRVLVRTASAFRALCNLMALSLISSQPLERKTDP